MRPTEEVNEYKHTHISRTHLAMYKLGTHTHTAIPKRKCYRPYKIFSVQRFNMILYNFHRYLPCKLHICTSIPHCNQSQNPYKFRANQFVRTRTQKKLCSATDARVAILRDAAHEFAHYRRAVLYAQRKPDAAVQATSTSRATVNCTDFSFSVALKPPRKSDLCGYPS